jgi:hypothetical protein
VVVPLTTKLPGKSIFETDIPARLICSIYAVPLTYKSLQAFVNEPKSNELLTAGIIDELTSPLKLIVSPVKLSPIVMKF